MRQLHCVAGLVGFGFLVVRAGAGAADREPQVPKWHRFEARFDSEMAYKAPVHEVEVSVDFTAPSGKTSTVRAFWDGGVVWRVRFSPDEVGAWRFVTRSSDVKNRGLHGRVGSFSCQAYKGGNALYRHGPVGVSESGHQLAHADRTPFFWLADTAWGGAILSDDKSWDVYLRDRVAKGFTAVQFMGTQFVAAAGDGRGRQAFGGQTKIAIDPGFFQRLDRRFDALNERGLVAVPAFAWAGLWPVEAGALNPGIHLPADQLIVLYRYALARYGAHQNIWIAGGDSDYKGDLPAKWRGIVRAAFGEHPRQPVTIHAAGRVMYLAEFGDEPWLALFGYQSSHTTQEKTMRWMTEGEPAQAWKRRPPRPIINIEANYEGHNDSATGKPFTAFDVRRASYWSTLTAPTAGVTYGAHGVWSWESEPAVPMNHPRSGVARPWFEAIKLPGSAQMRHLRDFFAARDWWRLRPAPEMVRDQPGVQDFHSFVAAAAADDHSFAVAYFPGGAPVTLDLTALGPKLTAKWFDPSNGKYTPAGKVASGGPQKVTPPAKNAAGDADFVLVVAPG